MGSCVSVHQSRVSTAALVLAGLAFATVVQAASTVLTHSDGSRTEIISHKGVSQIKTFNKAGKLVSKTLDDSVPTSGGGHYMLIDKYKKAGDTVTTTR
jgi:hypothetical protein